MPGAGAALKKFLDQISTQRPMARMSRRVKNVERTFVFNLGLAGESSIKSNGLYIDTMQCHSLVNRVFARQGMNVLIDNVEVGCQPGGAFEATILRLPQHWACVNGWTKAMSLWKQQQDERAEESGVESTRSRYHDFKVYFDDVHQTAGAAANLLPSGFYRADPASTTEYYDWDPSQVVVPNAGAPGNTAEYYLHMLGADSGSTSKGVIHAYAESRSRPFAEDPNIVDVPQGGLFGNMFDVGDDSSDIITNFQDHNNETPYLIGDHDSQEYYPGGSFQGIGVENPSGTIYPGQFVDIVAVNASKNYNTDSTGSFAAPCGLIKIIINSTGVNPGSPVDLGDAPFPLWVKVTLAPGYYQGIAATPMQEVN